MCVHNVKWTVWCWHACFPFMAKPSMRALKCLLTMHVVGWEAKNKCCWHHIRPAGTWRFAMTIECWIVLCAGVPASSSSKRKTSGEEKSKKSKTKKRRTEAHVSEEDTRDRPGLKDWNDFSCISVLELYTWNFCWVTCFVCLARHWFGHSAVKTKWRIWPWLYHDGCNARRLRHRSCLPILYCNNILWSNWVSQSIKRNCASKADSARHVVSMGQLFSNLQMPGGGGTLSSHLYIILACMWASFMSAFHMHACMRAYFTTPWGKSKVLSAMGTWTSPSNWARNLHSLIYRFNLTLPVQFEHVDLPVRWRNQHVMLPWPTLPFSSWVKTVFTKSYGQPLLGGHKLEETHKWTMMFSEFWERFKNARGTSHDVFRRHADRLQFCCPIAIHGDEGRGKLKRAVMATSVQPLVVPNGHAGHSFNTRYLHSIMPGELYEGDMTVEILQDALVEDLRSLYENGLPVSCMHMWHSHAQELSMSSGHACDWWL